MRSITSGLAAVNPGVNQRPSTASAIAPTPSARTVAARSIQLSRGPSCADVQHRTSRSTRSGACAATHMLIIPPIDSPHSDARSIPSRSRSASKSPPRSAIEYGPGGTGEDPWPRMS